MAWLLLSGYDIPNTEDLQMGWRMITDVTHARRLERVRGRKKPSYEDTRFTILLSWMAMFGEAIAGPATLHAAGLGDDRTVQRRFRKWFADLLERHLEQG